MVESDGPRPLCTADQRRCVKNQLPRAGALASMSAAWATIASKNANVRRNAAGHEQPRDSQRISICGEYGMCWAPATGKRSKASIFLAIRRPRAVKPSIVVVGASGNLLTAEPRRGLSLGRRIDAHDLIIRVNFAPTMGLQHAVGSRTHVLVAHPNAAQFSYKRQRHYVPENGAPSLMLILRTQRSGGEEWGRGWVTRSVADLERAAAPTLVRPLSSGWSLHTFSSRTRVSPSTGMVAVGIALELARIWGAPPPLIVGFGPSACQHYYNCNGSSMNRREGVGHNFTAEMDLLLTLRLAGKIALY